MGTAMLRPEDLFVDIDNHHASEIRLKSTLLEEWPDYYCQLPPSTLAAQWEVVDLIGQYLGAQFPDKFKFGRKGDTAYWENAMEGRKVTWKIGSDTIDGFAPLDFMGRQLQEDLLLLDDSGILRGGQLCFPSGWDLSDKNNRHFLEIHQPLPGMMGPMLESANKLLERLVPGRPLLRLNWGFRVSDQLDLSSRHSQSYRDQLAAVSSRIDASNAGEHIYIRTERQTLHRLPQTRWILFTIHTYNGLVVDELVQPERCKTMHDFLKTVPAPLQDYKLITPFTEKLVAYLANHIGEAG